MREIISSLCFMLGYDLIAISLGMSLRQVELERDLVVIMWYNVERRLR